MSKSKDATPSIERLLEIMARLRDPDTGCPWDKAQRFETIAPYTIEEAYEVADAIERGDKAALKDELGDLLFQVVFYAQMAREEEAFDFDEVADAISEKMLRRHPHVFGDRDVTSGTALHGMWETQKAEERAKSAERDGRPPSALDDVALALPALLRAHKLQKRAARVGFDWPDLAPVLDKIEEELEELKAEVSNGGGADRLEDEVGDLLFAVVNLARHIDIEPEQALRRANAKFERRFKAVESALAERGKTPRTSDLQEMDALWNEAKRQGVSNLD